jgi:hypothetical protein
MANGTSAAVIQLFPDAAPEPMEIRPSAPTEAEISVGRAVASAATALCRGYAELSDKSELSATTRRVGAERIYSLYELRRGVPEAAFTAMARREGRRVLLSYFEATPNLRATGELLVDGLIREILAAVAQVSEWERTAAN